MVGFELSGTASSANDTMRRWGESGRTVAAFNLGFDYLFILGYSNLMVLACLWASQKHSRLFLVQLGILVAWLQWLAGILDCIEDGALLKMLFGGASDTAAWIARISALGKFGLLGLALVYLASSLL
jgi:hypothetical protein